MEITESLPSLNTFPMNLKLCCETPDFTPLLQCLRDNGQPSSDLEESIEILSRLRRECISPATDFSGIERIMKYFGQIHLLSQRLDMNKGQPAYVKFKWNDTSFYGKVTGSVHLERYCMLFNMASIHFELGSAASRKETDETWKKSCQHFQCAAGILEWMKQNIKSENRSESALIQDESVDFHYQVALAHAQEQLLFKAVKDKRKLNLLAKLTQNVFEKYQSVLEDCQQMEFGEMGLKKHPEWDEFVYIRSSFYGALTWALIGTNYENGSEYGNAIYCFEKASGFVSSLPKTDKKRQLDEAPAIDFIRSSVTRKLDILKRDNSFIYHEKVPDSLPDVISQCLVKAFPFVPYDMKVVGPDLFPSVMPIDAVSATSLYSEMKDNLLREVSSQMEELNEHLKKFENNLDLKKLPHLDGFGVSLQEAPLPEELVERCARLSLKPSTPTELADSLQELTKMVREIDENLNLISEKLESECGRNAQLMEEHSIARDTSKIDEIAEKYEKLRNDHVGSNDKCKQLRQIVNENISNLKRLSETSLPELKQHLIKNDDGEVEEVDREPLQTMKRLIAKIDEMKDQRVKLFDQLKAALEADDITVLLSATKDSVDQDKLFETELKKHESCVALMKQNFEAQKNICSAVEEAYAQYALVRRKLYELNTRRERKANDLIFSFDSCVQMRDKIDEFSEFYKELNQNVSDLRHKLLILCKSEQIERERLEAAKKAKPQRPTAKKPNLPPTPSASSATLEVSIGGGAASMLDPDFLKTLTPEERELLETLSPEELQQLSGTMSSETPMTVPTSSSAITQPKTAIVNYNQYPAVSSHHLNTKDQPGLPPVQNYTAVSAGSARPVQNTGLYNNALLDTLTPDERRLLLGEDAPAVNNTSPHTSMLNSRNMESLTNSISGASYNNNFMKQMGTAENPAIPPQIHFGQNASAQIAATAPVIPNYGKQGPPGAGTNQQWQMNNHANVANSANQSASYPHNQNVYQPISDPSKRAQAVGSSCNAPNNQAYQYSTPGVATVNSLPSTHNQYPQYSQPPQSYITSPKVTSQSQFLPVTQNQYMPTQNSMQWYSSPGVQSQQMWNQSSASVPPRSLTPNSTGPSSLEMSREHVAMVEQMKQQQSFLMQQLETQNKRQAELEKQLVDQRMNHQLELQRQEKAKEREHEKAILEQQALLQEQINRQKALEKQLEEQNSQQQQILSQVWNVASMTQNYQQQLDQLKARAMNDEEKNYGAVDGKAVPQADLSSVNSQNLQGGNQADQAQVYGNQNFAPVPQIVAAAGFVSMPQATTPMYWNNNNNVFYQNQNQTVTNPLPQVQNEPKTDSSKTIHLTVNDSSKEVSQYVAAYDPKKPMDPKVLAALMKQQQQQKPMQYSEPQKQPHFVTSQKSAQISSNLNINQFYGGNATDRDVTAANFESMNQNNASHYTTSRAVVPKETRDLSGSVSMTQNSFCQNVGIRSSQSGQQNPWINGHGVSNYDYARQSIPKNENLAPEASSNHKSQTDLQHAQAIESSTKSSNEVRLCSQHIETENQTEMDQNVDIQSIADNLNTISVNEALKQQTMPNTKKEESFLKPQHGTTSAIEKQKLQNPAINEGSLPSSEANKPSNEANKPPSEASKTDEDKMNQSTAGSKNSIPSYCKIPDPGSKIPEQICVGLERSSVARSNPINKTPTVLTLLDQSLPKLVTDVEKLEKHLANVNKRTLNGPTILEREWKELETRFVKDYATSKQKAKLKLGESIPCLKSSLRTEECFTSNTVTRSVQSSEEHSSKLVFVDVDMEFDLVPRFLLLGSDNSSDYQEKLKLFWEMVSECDISLIVSFSGRNQPCPYMPAEQGVNMAIGKDLLLRLQNTSISQYWLQRTVNIFSTAQNTNRSVTHLQFLEWPSVETENVQTELFPKHAPFLSFVRTVRHFYSLHSNFNQPVLLQCKDGVTQSGLLMLLLKCMQGIDHGFGLNDVSTEINAIRHFHQAIVTSPSQMFFLYICYLHYVQQFLSATNKANHTCFYQVINSASPYGLPSLQPISTKTSCSDSNRSGETNNSIQINNESDDKSGNSGGVRDLRALMTADNFSIGSQSGSPKGPKRHNFDDNTLKIGQETNPNDPFSSLDPLWKMK